ncbi:MAG: hypothetical protein Q9213_007731 [Squamulea squamosa]
MAKTTWKAVKASQIQKPQPAPPLKTEANVPAPSTKKKGRAAQKFLDRFLSKKAKTEKPKTERGEERPEKRTHHCAFCGKTFTHVCRDKKHMVPCKLHKTIYTIPGKPCRTCIEEDEAKARNAAKATKDIDTRVEEAKLDAFFVGEKGRKKPGVKASRLSFDAAACRVN